MFELLAWVAVCLASCSLSLTLFNVLFWTRGRVTSTTWSPTVSILIPARDEESNIGTCLTAALASQMAPDEVWVCDDHSTDATAEIITSFQGGVVPVFKHNSRDLPAGWYGKPNACHQLAACASGDVLVYVDADTQLSESGLQRLLYLMEQHDADIVTAVPRQVTGGWFERWILPLLHLTYTSWLPIPLIWRTRDDRVVAANGQIMAIKRESYEAIGGFEAIRDEVVDDMALCRRAKRLGRRVVFADGFHIATCRMYRSPREVWEGFSKNIYKGIGGNLWALFCVSALYSITFISPYILLAFGLTVAPHLIVPAAIGVALNTCVRVIIAFRWRYSLLGVIEHPLAVFSLLAIAYNSFRWVQAGRILWRGRVYGDQELVTSTDPSP